LVRSVEKVDASVKKRGTLPRLRTQALPWMVCASSSANSLSRLLP